MVITAVASHSVHDWQALLRDVSRSFYLTVRILPGAIRPAIATAYLLARATDTIADTDLVPLERRLKALRGYAAAIGSDAQPPAEIAELIPSQSNPAEALLLERSRALLATMRSLPEFDQAQIRKLLQIIAGGQELDLIRFGGKGILSSLSNDQELDDYTFRVAGCVGEFWTRICLSRYGPIPGEENLLLKAVRFGKGLQLVNILRDLPADLKAGRCYIPAQALREHGLAPEDLLEPATEERFRPLFNRYLALAWDHLNVGWVYTNTLPRSWFRIRQACAWPVLIGASTLVKLHNNPILSGARVKISRQDVRKVMWRSVSRYPWPAGWRKLFPERPGF